MYFVRPTAENIQRIVDDCSKQVRCLTYSLTHLLTYLLTYSLTHSLTHSPTVHSHYMQLYRSFYLHFITRIDRPLMSVRPVPRHHCPGAHTLHSQHTTLVRCVQQTLTGGNSNPSIHHSTRSETHEFSSCVRSVAYHTSSEWRTSGDART